MSKFAFVLLMVSLLAPTPALADGKECPLPDHLKQRGYDCNSVGDFDLQREHFEDDDPRLPVIHSKPIKVYPKLQSKPIKRQKRNQNAQ